MLKYCTLLLTLSDSSKYCPSAEMARIVPGTLNVVTVVEPGTIAISTELEPR